MNIQLKSRFSLLVLGFICTTTYCLAKPTITSFTPTSGPIGTSVTIIGTNFDASPVNNTIIAEDGSTTQDWIVTVEGTNAQDSLALVALYNSTDGPNWTDNSNWLSGTVDSWYGVNLCRVLK